MTDSTDHADPDAAVDDRTQLHASAVVLDGRGCLILGASGSGKSTLALEMIALGARLIGDDRIDIAREGDEIALSGPAQTSGLIEARGVGILSVEAEASAPLHVVVDLDQTELRRLPENRKLDLLGVPCSVIFGRDRHGLAALLSVYLRNGGLVDPTTLAT